MNLQNTPHTASEVVTGQEQDTQTGVEATPIAEIAPTTPAMPPVSVDDTQSSIAAVGQVVTAQDDNITAEEIADLTDADVDKADNDWIGQVKDVIKKDSGQPFKEEEDAELLNEAYMKQRFNVDVDAPIEEK